MLELIFRLRWVSVVSVVFAGLGCALMMIVGAGTTIHGIGTYLGANEERAFSEEAGAAATVEMISSLDQFLLALVLFIFAYGVFRLFIYGVEDSSSERLDWFSINSVTDLKVKLLETIAILLAVVFLKSALKTPDDSVLEWSDLVLPISVGIFAISVLVIKRAH